jgi:hypothetical protein
MDLCLLLGQVLVLGFWIEYGTWTQLPRLPIRPWTSPPRVCPIHSPVTTLQSRQFYHLQRVLKLSQDLDNALLAPNQASASF